MLTDIPRLFVFSFNQLGLRICENCVLIWMVSSIALDCLKMD